MAQREAQSFTVRKGAWSGPLAHKVRPEPVRKPLNAARPLDPSWRLLLLVLRRLLLQLLLLLRLLRPLLPLRLLLLLLLRLDYQHD